MNSFRFPLEKVLAWRRSQLEIEESHYRQTLAAVARLDRDRAELEASGIQAEVQVRAWTRLAGADLEAGHAFALCPECTYVSPKTPDLWRTAHRGRTFLYADLRILRPKGPDPGLRRPDPSRDTLEL